MASLKGLPEESVFSPRKKKHGRTAKLYLTKRQDFWKSVQG